MMNSTIQLLDVVALTTDLPKHSLFRGEIGAVVECYPNDVYEVEFVSLDGYTYALVTLRGHQLIPLRQKPQRMATTTVPATMFASLPSVDPATAAEQPVKRTGGDLG
jgi:hypothetical protein